MCETLGLVGIEFLGLPEVVLVCSSQRKDSACS